MNHIHVINVFMGFLAGLVCSLGGALKDCPYEGFFPLKFCRSIIVGTLCGAVSSFFVPEDQPVVIFMFAGYSERMIVEGYKIIRAKKPGKFDLPHASMLGRRLGFQRTHYQGGEYGDGNFHAGGGSIC